MSLVLNLNLKNMKHRASVCVLLAILVSTGLVTRAAPSANRITILFDAFGRNPALKPDWGFSALIEYNGKRILFDTGNDAAIFETNAKTLRADLRKLDFVVISHRHGDHTNGLHYLLSINPNVKIYAPVDEHFGGMTPPAFLKRGMPSLPADMRYFGGSIPSAVPHGSAWRNVKFAMVEKLIEIAPGIHLIPTISQVAGTMELQELSLSLQTPNGQILVVGCSHPGIEKIVEAATAIDARIEIIFGGLHLVTTAEPDIERIVTALHDRWHVARIAPGHCTGEPAFASLQRTYGAKYVYAGLGSMIPLP
jgi:7,8-dihydropterin-6-yl-methyl-4-(beta-D-ribofuranosyl)aminobenzene 5'-phosphate synthase